MKDNIEFNVDLKVPEQKVIFCDIDGTLLNDEKLIDEKAKIKIQELINNNTDYHFALASGRSLYEELMIYKGLKLKNTGLLIGSNGSQVYSLKSHKIIFECCINKDAVLAIHHKLEELMKINKKLSFLVSYNDSSAFINNIPNDEWVSYCIQELKLRESFDPNNVLLFTILNLGDNLVQMQDFLASLDLTVIPGSNLTAITAKGVSKASAIEHVIKKYDLKNENIAVFGDSKNDVTMFQIPEVYSVTYTGAKTYLKRIAKEVIDLPKSEFIYQALIDFQDYIDQKNKKNNSK